MSGALVLFGTLTILILLNVPIAVSLGVASLIAILYEGVALSILPIVVYASIAKFTLLAVPFFITAGLVMEKAGISARLIRLANALVGHLAGGLAIVTILTSMFFAAISGSGPATVAALGVILIPAMREAGYDVAMSAALMATAGAIGVIIPPSITYVVYGVVAEQSIGRMFVAGIVPGIVMGICLMVASYWIARKNDYKGLARASWSETWAAFKDAFWGLLTPVIILGGIYGGFFTPTEAAAVSVVYGLFVGVFIYKQITWPVFFRTLVDSAISNAVVMLVIGSATLFAWVVTTAGISETINAVLLSTTSSPFWFLVIANTTLLIAGCFMDGVSAIYIFTPILFPVATKLGIDPIHFGIVMCVNLAIGLVTPPVGANLYVACGITEIPLKKIIAGLSPFLVASMVALVLVTYVPSLTVWLPTYLGIK